MAEPELPRERPRGAAEDQERRENAARRPRPQRDEPHHALDQQQRNDDARRKAVVEQRLNSAVTGAEHRSEEHTSELQSLMRISYAVFCLKKQTQNTHTI